MAVSTRLVMGGNVLNTSGAEVWEAVTVGFEVPAVWVESGIDWVEVPAMT